MFSQNQLTLALFFTAAAAAATTTSDRVQVDWVGASWWPDCRQYAKFVWPLLKPNEFDQTAVNDSNNNTSQDDPTDHTNTNTDFNSIVDFAFWPNQAQTLEACTNNNTDAEHSYLCKIDHFEACTLQSLDCVGGCQDDTKQRKLFQFLYCFEGEHVKALPGKDYPGPSWLKAMKPCATKAGLDYDAIQTCASNVSSGSALSVTFDQITKYVASQPLKYFPWVTLNNVIMGNQCDTCLESWVCGNYTGTNKPNSCSDTKRPTVC